jgi:O-antigen ligase
MNINRTTIYQKINYILILSLSFFIPVYKKIVPLIIALLLLNWLIQGDFKTKISRFVKNRFFAILFISLYLIYLIGLCYTKNLYGTANCKGGLFDIQVKLSLLVLPLILFTINDNFLKKEKINTILLLYILGCIVGSLICLGNATYNFCKTNSYDYFYYTYMSILHHPSYFAMFLDFAICIILFWIIEKYNYLSIIKKIILGLIVTYFIVFIMLLSSKAGIISLIAIFIIEILYLIIQKKEYFTAALSFLYIFLLLFIAINTLPRSAIRLISAKNAIEHKEDIKKNSAESTADRIMIWKSSIEIIKDNFLFGVGTGSVKDILLKKYKEKQLSAPFNKRLNAHNQYLQTFIAVGITGFLILILNLIIPAIYAFKRKNILYLFFIGIISINFLVESMLEVQDGVIFYAFFNSFLLLFTKKGLK